MNITLSSGTPQIRLPTRLTLASSAAVRSELLACLEAHGGRLILDLSDVEVADSSGLSALLACVREARARNGIVVLLSPTPRVQALIELTRLDDVAPLVASEAIAVQRIGAHTGN